MNLVHPPHEYCTPHMNIVHLRNRSSLTEVCLVSNPARLPILAGCFTRDCEAHAKQPRTSVREIMRKESHARASVRNDARSYASVHQSAIVVALSLPLRDWNHVFPCELSRNEKSGAMACEVWLKLTNRPHSAYTKYTK